MPIRHTPRAVEEPKGQYLLYFVETGRFGWPDTDWTGFYLQALNNEARIPLGARAEDLYPEQRAELDKLKGEFFEAHGGLAPEFGFGDWAVHDPKAAADRAKLFDAFFPDGDGALRRRLAGAARHEVMVMGPKTPVVETREPDSYVRRKFGIERKDT